VKKAASTLSINKVTDEQRRQTKPLFEIEEAVEDR
jgi:hypothetical protein